MFYVDAVKTWKFKHDFCLGSLSLCFLANWVPFKKCEDLCVRTELQNFTLLFPQLQHIFRTTITIGVSN